MTLIILRQAVLEEWDFNIKESVEIPALFFVLFKGVEFETVGYKYGGNPLQNVTDSKSIKTDDVF